MGRNSVLIELLPSAYGCGLRRCNAMHSKTGFKRAEVDSSCLLQTQCPPNQQFQALGQNQTKRTARQVKPRAVYMFNPSWKSPFQPCLEAIQVQSHRPRQDQLLVRHAGNEKHSQMQKYYCLFEEYKRSRTKPKGSKALLLTTIGHAAASSMNDAANMSFM